LNGGESSIGLTKNIVGQVDRRLQADRKLNMRGGFGEPLLGVPQSSYNLIDFLATGRAILPPRIEVGPSSAAQRCEIKHGFIKYVLSGMFYQVCSASSRATEFRVVSTRVLGVGLEQGSHTLTRMLSAKETCASGC
jgi:hypothetical protein